MKRLYTQLIYAVSVLALALCASCEEAQPDTPPSSEPDVPADTVQTKSYGTYEFDGDVYDIYTAYYEDTGAYYNFLFSPLYPGTPVSTYVLIGARNHWCDGEVHDVNDQMNPLAQNDDYIFIYEDPVHYYSQYRKFQSGNIQIGLKGNGEFVVRLDVLLIDGTPFKIDFEGELPAAE